MIIEHFRFRFQILLLARHLPAIERGEVPLTYPFWFDLDTFDRVTFPLVAGGIELKEDYTIESIYIASLTYFVKSQSKDDLDCGAKWEDAFLTAAPQPFTGGLRPSGPKISKKSHKCLPGPSGPDPKNILRLFLK